MTSITKIVASIVLLSTICNGKVALAKEPVKIERTEISKELRTCLHKRPKQRIAVCFAIRTVSNGVKEIGKIFFYNQVLENLLNEEEEKVSGSELN